MRSSEINRLRHSTPKISENCNKGLSPNADEKNYRQMPTKKIIAECRRVIPDELRNDLLFVPRRATTKNYNCNDNLQCWTCHNVYRRLLVIVQWLATKNCKIVAFWRSTSIVIEFWIQAFLALLFKVYPGPNRAFHFLGVKTIPYCKKK